MDDGAISEEAQGTVQDETATRLPRHWWLVLFLRALCLILYIGATFAIAWGIIGGIVSGKTSYVVIFGVWMETGRWGALVIGIVLGFGCVVLAAVLQALAALVEDGARVR